MIRIEILNPFQEREQIREIWMELQQTSQHSFFNTWGWIDAWLESLPKGAAIQCVVGLEDQVPRCAFFIGQQQRRLGGLFPKRHAFLNETGVEEFDELTIEYNAALGHGQHNCLNSIFADTHFNTVEEFHLSAVSQRAFDDLDIPDSTFSKKVHKIPCFYVDLEEIRQNNISYIETLSTNKRSQIRRSLKEYETKGEITLSEAQSVSEAHEMLAELKELHQQGWARRGQPGAFKSDFFNRFHRSLIESRFDKGEIQLLRIGNSGGTIGCLYNFIYKNQVLYYQSGFNYGNYNILRPGIVSHYHAIQHNLRANRSTYNFLAGEGQYKQSLTSHNEFVYTLKVSRKNLKWRIEHALRKALGRPAN